MSSIKHQYDQQGFVIVPNLVPSPHFEKLQAACDRVISKTRAGEWTKRRTVGKQFPPFDDDNPDSWGVQHVMHPDLREPEFAVWYTSDGIIHAVCELLECSRDELQMELFNLLINPVEHNFALRWHRDDVSESATAEEEIAALRISHHGVQWNTALYDDECLFVVPNSHSSPRTPEQRAKSLDMTPPTNPLDMPMSIRVHLQPGETVFYNSNILHCAAYDSTKPRATLHACVGDIRGGTTRARNILQHGLEWMIEDQFRDTLGERGKQMLDRLLYMKGSVDPSKVGYSLTG